MKKFKCFTKHGSHKPLHFRVHTSNSVQTHRLDTWENTGKNIFTGMREKNAISCTYCKGGQSFLLFN